MQSFSCLPQEVILDILSWLPAKSVGQCRCVCKLWRSLLSQPQFIRTHLNRAQLLQLQSFCYHQDYSYLRCVPFSSANLNAHHLFDEMTLFAKNLSFPDRLEYWTWDYIHGSCDGLILVGDNYGIYYLINPATREIKEVPDSPSALNLELTVCRVGFGYDSITHDYKIVTICFYDGYYFDSGRTDTVVSIYSLKYNTWKKVGSFPFHPDPRSYNSSVFVDGYIHLLAYKQSNRTTTKDYVSVIAAFDLAYEKFSEVPLPTLLEDKVLQYYDLVALGGRLSLYSSIECPESDVIPLEIDVWMMKEYGVQNSWSKMFTIINSERAWITPVFLLGQEQMVLVKIIPQSTELVMCNRKEGTLKDIVVHEFNIESFRNWTPFTETLVSPHYSN